MQRFSQHQRGFSTVEAVIIAAIVLALGGVGYWIYARQADKAANTAPVSQGESVDAPAAPELNSADDLDDVDEALNQLNVEAGNSDNAALDTQTSRL